MVHAIDLVLLEDLFHARIKGLRRAEIGAERLLDDHSPEVAAALLDQPGGAELVDDRAKHRGRNRQIEDDVALGPVVRLDLFEMRAKPAIDLGIVEIAADKADAVAKPTPGFLVKRDRYAAHLAARHEAANLLAEVVAEPLVGLLGAAEPDARKISRQEPGAGEVVDGRHDQPLGQIAGGAENDQRTRRCSRAVSCATR